MSLADKQAEIKQALTESNQKVELLCKQSEEELKQVEVWVQEQVKMLAETKQNF